MALNRQRPAQWINARIEAELYRIERFQLAGRLDGCKADRSASYWTLFSQVILGANYVFSDQRNLSGVIWDAV
jgi:hypothetical protein